MPLTALDFASPDVEHPDVYVVTVAIGKEAWVVCACYSQADATKLVSAMTEAAGKQLSRYDATEHTWERPLFASVRLPLLARGATMRYDQAEQVTSAIRRAIDLSGRLSTGETE